MVNPKKNRIGHPLSFHYNNQTYGNPPGSTINKQKIVIWLGAEIKAPLPGSVCRILENDRAREIEARRNVAAPLYNTNRFLNGNSIGLLYRGCLERTIQAGAIISCPATCQVIDFLLSVK